MVGALLVPVRLVGKGWVMTEGLEVPAGLVGGRRVNVGTCAEVSSEAVGWTGLEKRSEERKPDGRPEDLGKLVHRRVVVMMWMARTGRQGAQ